MADLEKNNEEGGTYHVNRSLDGDEGIGRIHTAGNFTISPELFEKLYLAPRTAVSNNLRSTFANPTPLAIAGFIMSLTPLSNVLLEMRGSGGLGAAQTGAFYFFGGMLMTLSGVLEFVLGNTFPFLVFCSYGGYWLTFGATLTPQFNSFGAYSPSASNPSLGISDPTFMSSYAFFDLWMAALSFVFLIGSLRTNLVYVLIFLTLSPMYCCLAASFWEAAQGHAAMASTLQHVGGGFAFASSLLGWYLFLAMVLTSVDFPFTLPLGDLSRFIKPLSAKGVPRG